MVQATQSYFTGNWQMVRIIENVFQGVIGEVWGTATFRPDGAGLTCHEEGVLRFQGQDYHTERAALWRFGPDDRIEVRYEDGRPFHDFLTRDPIALSIDGTAEYRISYEFAARSWEALWEMTEPGLRYTMVTRYRR